MKKINFTQQTPRIIVSVLIGLLFILFPDFFRNFAIYIIGSVITLFGIGKLIYYFSVKDNYVEKTIPLGAIIIILVGTIILLQADIFTSIIMFSLGFILLIAGLGQIINYLKFKTTSVVPIKLYIFPALMFIAGILAIINPFGAVRSLIVFFGVMMLFYGISELISMSVIKVYPKDEF